MECEWCWRRAVEDSCLGATMVDLDKRAVGDRGFFDEV